MTKYEIVFYQQHNNYNGEYESEIFKEETLIGALLALAAWLGEKDDTLIRVMRAVEFKDVNEIVDVFNRMLKDYKVCKIYTVQDLYIQGGGKDPDELN